MRSKNRGARALLTITMLAAVSASLPGRAAISQQPPSIQKTSIDNGWTRSASAVAAVYDDGLAAGSTAEMRDKDGDVVPGFASIGGPGSRTLTWAAVGKAEEDPAPLSAKRSPYTVTFTVRGITQDLATFPDAVVDTKIFSVDTRPPAAPASALTPAPAVPDGVVVVPSGGALQVSGMANDRAADIVTGASGIQRVELHFYNAATTVDPLDVARSGREVEKFRRSFAAQPCADACDGSLEYAWDIESLPSGYWNLKVSAVDAAGWRSQESEPIKILWLG